MSPPHSLFSLGKGKVCRITLEIKREKEKKIKGEMPQLENQKFTKKDLLMHVRRCSKISVHLPAGSNRCFEKRR